MWTFTCRRFCRRTWQKGLSQIVEEIVDVAVPQSVEDGGGDSTCAFGAQPSTESFRGYSIGCRGCRGEKPTYAS